ncbi:hypothetical protein [Streptomyces sp. NPDC006463]|uniref:hypothetical protein n=1 Tax=Streptomyces sp. NPDC006463 TaxID=3364746 RepID=UPI0036999144
MLADWLQHPLAGPDGHIPAELQPLRPALARADRPRGVLFSADQVEHLEARLTVEDPREVAEVCGGWKEPADQLGYPRPGPRRRA